MDIPDPDGTVVRIVWIDPNFPPFLGVDSHEDGVLRTYFSPRLTNETAVRQSTPSVTGRIRITSAAQAYGSLFGGPGAATPDSAAHERCPRGDAKLRAATCLGAREWAPTASVGRTYEQALCSDTNNKDAQPPPR